MIDEINLPIAITGRHESHAPFRFCGGCVGVMIGKEMVVAAPGIIYPVQTTLSLPCQPITAVVHHPSIGHAEGHLTLGLCVVRADPARDNCILMDKRQAQAGLFISPGG